MPLRVCKHCGFNFMNPDLNPDSKNLCNNCQLKEPKQKTKENEMKDEVKILIIFPRNTHIEIEELCMNLGINFSEYFLELHKLNTQKEFKFKSRSRENEVNLPESFGKLTSTNPEIKNFGEKFEESACSFISPPKKICRQEAEKNLPNTKRNRK